MKPNGLMTLWQAGHAPVWVTLSTFWRSVPVAVAGIAVLTPAGGWPSGMHITLRVKNTPRFTRRVVSGPECEVITPGSVKIPSRCFGSSDVSVVAPDAATP